jgi:AcrR family transcriptional regulator
MSTAISDTLTRMANPIAARRYHHGNLREALQEAVLQIVAEHGVGAVTMADAARRAGVTPTAPYRHYADLDDLLVTTAVASYERFRASQAATLAGIDDPLERLLATISHFIGYEREDPGGFELIFDSGIQRRSRQLDTWAQADYDALVAMTVEITGAPPDECRELALGISSIAFGQVALNLHRFSPVSTPDEAPDLARAAIAMLIHGFQTRNTHS